MDAYIHARYLGGCFGKGKEAQMTKTLTKILQFVNYLSLSHKNVFFSFSYPFPPLSSRTKSKLSNFEMGVSVSNNRFQIRHHADPVAGGILARGAVFG